MTSFVFVPTMATPDGPIHLGHIAGPYLKPDVLARHLRRHGHQVAIVTGSNIWDTKVLTTARMLGIPPEAVCSRYREDLIEGLKGLDIDYDAIVDPLTFRHRYRLEGIVEMVLKRLGSLGKLRLIKERIPFSVVHNEPLVGGAISGTCPVCHRGMRGFHCKFCGSEISPGDLIDPRSDLPNDTIGVRKYTSLFMEVSDPGRLLEALAERCSDPTLIETAQAQMIRTKGLVRLSHPGRWGIPVQTKGITGPAVFFCSSMQFAFSLLCGEIGCDALQEREPAFHKGSDVKTATFFGPDDQIPYLVSSTAQALEGEDWVPADHYVSNRFYSFEGDIITKSTSTLAARDAAQHFGRTSDLLRLYLIKTNPDTGSGTFSTSQFESFSGDMFARLLSLLTRAFDPATRNINPDHDAVLHGLFERQSRCLDLSVLDFNGAIDALDAWLDYGDSHCICTGWAAGLSLLAVPFMPKLSQECWRRCQFEGLPTIDAIRNKAGSVDACVAQGVPT